MRINFRKAAARIGVGVGIIAMIGGAVGMGIAVQDKWAFDVALEGTCKKISVGESRIRAGTAEIARSLGLKGAFEVTVKYEFGSSEVPPSIMMLKPKCGL